MLRLLNERLNRPDCKMQGFVLDGFPKTPLQFDFLGEDIVPTLIIILHCEQEACIQEACIQRLENKSGKRLDKESLQKMIDRKMRRWQQIQEKLEQT